MLRRLISTVALLALVTAPVVARTRLFCRYTGVEITGCAEQGLPTAPVIEADGCCNRLVMRPVGAVVQSDHPEAVAPVLAALPLPPESTDDVLPTAADDALPGAPTGPPVYLLHRAFLN